MPEQKKTQSQNRFAVLNSIDVSNHTEKKNGLTYLSWAWAWTELKKIFPDSFYTIYENAEGLNYFHDGKTCWVKTGVTLVDGDFVLEHIEMLPIMDFRNKSIELKSITSMDVNKAIQRSLTKAIARHGLGCYIYAGEDLPEDEEAPQKPKQVKVHPFDPLPPTLPVAEKPKVQMATGQQIDYILANIDYQNYEAATAAFGTDLERMSYKQAEKLIERIRNTEVGTNGEAV